VVYTCLYQSRLWYNLLLIHITVFTIAKITIVINQLDSKHMVITDHT